MLERCLFAVLLVAGAASASGCERRADAQAAPECTVGGQACAGSDAPREVPSASGGRVSGGQGGFRPSGGPGTPMQNLDGGVGGFDAGRIGFDSGSGGFDAGNFGFDSGR